MKKYFFIIFFLLFSSSQAATHKNEQILNYKQCKYNSSKNFLETIDNQKIKLIEVDIHDYRKWTVNGVRILTNRYRYVPEKFKRRFDSTVTVTLENHTKCSFEGRVRHSGDEKDHIGMIENSITQSLDVHLINGNIKGITKFKLLRPLTRGNLEDEILVTEVLRNLNFLAPRSFKVKARVNELTTIMLFQEKAAKEMLEFNKRREGPILEADERFFFKSVSKIEDNQKSGWDLGVVPLMNQSSKYMLSKQINTNILEKGEAHKKMSFDAVNYLNLIYLYFSNRFQDEQNNFNYFDYDLENKLLSKFNNEKNFKLDEYNLFMQATNSNHGLAANNRKFYWNSIEDYFEPINYDSNSKINKNVSKDIIRYPISNTLEKSFIKLRKKINNLNKSTILKNLELSGLNYSKEKLNKKFTKILNNLDQLEKNYNNLASKKMIKHNEIKSIDNILANFHKNLKKNHPDTYLIKSNFDMNNFQKCEIFLEKCIEINLSSEDLSSLLEGELTKNNADFQYLGKDFNISNFINHYEYNEEKFKDSLIFYEEGVEVTLDEANNQIKINQIISGAKTFIINGKLKDTNLIYEGFVPINNNIVKPRDFPINERGLTGCLTLINLEVQNVNVNASNSSCEDSVNFINTSGNVNNINILNSMSDAFDVDFSYLKIKKIFIDKAKNDCVDFSFGNYEISNLQLSNCGDKALSVGEKSKLSLIQLDAKNSVIGVASKDSSIVNIQNAKFNSVGTCLAAYKKKQEFEGGIINYNKMNCDFIKEQRNQDKNSLINKNEKI